MAVRRCVGYKVIAHQADPGACSYFFACILQRIQQFIHSILQVEEVDVLALGKVMLPVLHIHIVFHRPFLYYWGMLPKLAVCRQGRSLNKAASQTIKKTVWQPFASNQGWEKSLCAGDCCITGCLRVVAMLFTCCYNALHSADNGKCGAQSWTGRLGRAREGVQARFKKEKKC